MIKEITVNELNQCLNAKKEFQLIDVREPHEKAIADIGGELIPLSSIPKSLNRIGKKPVVVYCRSGKRSADATQYLQQNLKRDDIYNLKGGILAWSDEIDSSIVKY
ncbi:rhodanese-like domain-containing protein [Parvicella tangerina]|uniref:Sulfurtransferase n=1 Tax=Parvicella tangerina TaxID=2829795 RepID=A0A916JLA2_9FLAO|nr:rhodanese-like domain-containing protein [Parvicella tangerina]CAG5077323.1 Sulfurtransferase [Parvicella tangerina]